MTHPAELPENEQLARVILKPVEYLKLALEDEQNAGRGAALIVTKEDIFTIKRYERHGLSLPITLTRIEQQLGFVRSDIAGLEPSDLLETYRATHQHAASWSSIEQNIKLTGIDIDLFARKFTQQGADIVSYIEKMDLFDQLEHTVSELTLEIIQGISSAPLSAAEQKVCFALSEFLKTIAAQIDAYQQSAESLTGQISTFTQTLSVHLIPSIRHKAALAERSDLDQQIKNLEEDIARLTQDIEQKNDEYKSTTKNVAWGIFGGPIGVAITGGIYGSKAENIRKERNRMIHEKEAKLNQLAEKRPLAAAVRRLELLLEDMDVRMLDAYRSATNLQDLWAMISAYIKNSATELAGIKDNQALLTFALQFQSVVTPWEEIKDITHSLLAIFDSALTEFARQSKQSFIRI